VDHLQSTIETGNGPVGLTPEQLAIGDDRPLFETRAGIDVELQPG